MDQVINFKTVVARFGKGTFLVVVLAVTFSHWGIINISGVPIPHFVDILYAYLLFNGIAVTPFVYLERRAKAQARKTCPSCGAQLEENLNFTCPTCGRIRFEKK